MLADPDQIGNETIAHLTAMHEEHLRASSPIQRAINRTTAFLARPIALTAIMTLVAIYMAGNMIAALAGSRALERFPFPDLEFIATIVALFVALLILATQRHEDALADRRARLTLQIAAISERKIAKLIELMEEQRRDNPLLSSRPDPEAAIMANPADPEATRRQVDAVEPIVRP